MCDGAIGSGIVWTKARAEMLCMVAMESAQFEREEGGEGGEGGMKGYGSREEGTKM